MSLYVYNGGKYSMLNSLCAFKFMRPSLLESGEACVENAVVQSGGKCMRALLPLA